MASWVGQNWQLVDLDGVTATIGVTFGMGLFDEAVDSTGSLSIALAALRTELARPVELATGGACLPEALAEVTTDTSTLLVRGSLETVAAAWGRLPALFSSDIVADDQLPLRSDQPLWPADLLRRTGRNAAALAGLPGVAAPNVHELARSLVQYLNPLNGRIPAVFFTTDESLVGTTFPVQERESGPAAGTRWADGTRAGDRAAEDSDATEASSSIELPGAPAPTAALASALVPRSAAGLAAAQVLHRQLATTAAQTLNDPTRIHAELTGMGPDYCLFLIGNPVLGDDARKSLLEKFSRTFALIPDAWVDEAIVAVASSTSVLERERKVFGLGPIPEVSRTDVLRVVARAADGLHLALSPLAAEGHADDDTRVRAPGPPQHPGRSRTFTTWTRGRPGPTPAATASKLAFGESVIFAGVKPSVRAAPVFWQAGVDTTRALAVLEDQAGTITILDDQLRTVSFHPLLFRRRRALQQLLDDRLAGVPRLTYRTSLDRGEMERWARRSKVTAISLQAVAVGMAVFIAAMVVLQNTAPPNVTSRLTATDTAELNNGTKITASAFDIVLPNPDNPEYTVTVQVNFCAGSDTKTGKLPAETQRTVSPEDFSMFDESYSTARQVESSGQLRPGTLRSGQCATGDLVYKGLQLANPRLSYKNEVGDDVIWYRYGQGPKQ